MYASNEPPIVLVIDDEKETADLYSEILDSEYCVITAYSGREALEKLDNKVDVVLLDRRMPGRSGDEILTEIRSREDDCRVVMVTAVDPDIDVISMEFDDYLVKPVSAGTLHNTVDRMIARNRLDASLLDAFALASKMATLESKMNPVELEASGEYTELEARFAEFRDLFEEIYQGEDLYTELSAIKMEALLPDR